MQSLGILLTDLAFRPDELAWLAQSQRFAPAFEHAAPYTVEIAPSLVRLAASLDAAG